MLVLRVGTPIAYMLSLRGKPLQGKIDLGWKL
jgi:hypothetical protein